MSRRNAIVADGVRKSEEDAEAKNCWSAVHEVAEAAVTKPGFVKPMTLPALHVIGRAAVIEEFVRKPGLVNEIVPVVVRGFGVMVMPPKP